MQTVRGVTFSFLCNYLRNTELIEKVSALIGHGWAGGLNGFDSVIDMTHDGFVRQHTESLHRMGQGYVDGLLMHSQPLPGTDGWHQLTEQGGFRAMSELRASGAVSVIGTGGGTYESISAMLPHCALD
eukprot:SAG31_NODE_29839_length_389_cov_0.713793_1_plen_127_part_10